MDRNYLKEQVKQAKERFKKYTSFENLLFVSELLELESEKYEIENQNGIAIDLRKLSLDVDKIMSEIF